MQRFLAFLAPEHRGGRPTLATLQTLGPRMCAPFAHQARRAEGLGPAGVQRALAGLRSFYRYLERENLAGGAVLRAVAAQSCRAPCRARGARPMTVRTIVEAGQEERPGSP